jgi:hypothetical protein
MNKSLKIRKKSHGIFFLPFKNGIFLLLYIYIYNWHKTNIQSLNNVKILANANKTRFLKCSKSHGIFLPFANYGRKKIPWEKKSHGKIENPMGKCKNPMGTPTLLINFIVKKTRFLSENNQLLINDKTFIAYYVSK